MICYNCGGELSEKDYCTRCGADVGLYKKVLFMSNRYYNEALDRCSVRDLSGAIELLQQSLKLNVNNVDAHNLLGLVYFEIGEVIEGLGQWVISASIRAEKNIATDYIALIQENTIRLDGMNQNLHKFNQALSLCYQGSLDYAVIQLKKILSIAPKYLKAHQLLALIYIKTQEWEKAKHEVEKCAKIDVGNTITMRYAKEIERALAPVDEPRGRGRKKSKNEEGSGVQVYQSGNETIIQPVNKSQSRAGAILLNIGIGVLIGVAVSYFLILPARIYSVNEAANETVSAVSDEKDKKAAELDALTLEFDKLKSENEELKNNLSQFGAVEGSNSYADNLMMAVNSYMNDPEGIAGVASALEKLEDENGVRASVDSESFNALYTTLMNQIGPQLASYHFNIGYSDYKNEDYEASIPNLRRAYSYDNTNEEALFYLGNAYRRTDNFDAAKEVYAEVVDYFPGTDMASKAETYLAELNN